MKILFQKDTIYVYYSKLVWNYTITNKMIYHDNYQGINTLIDILKLSVTDKNDLWTIYQLRSTLKII